MADKGYKTINSEVSMSTAAQRRPRIAFFDYPDVFEDFYPHYDVDQRTFATIWANSGNHAFIKLLQRDIGDVTWYVLSLSPAVPDSDHAETGCRSQLCQILMASSAFVESILSTEPRMALAVGVSRLCNLGVLPSSAVLSSDTKGPTRQT